MIYLAMALYAEAAPFIRALGLKKEETRTRFQLFVSDTHRLIVTGTGSLTAAIADTWLLSHYPPDPDRDFFAQIGTCGSLPDSDSPAVPVGSLYLCHKLTDAMTGRSFYPDMLYRSDFSEASLMTWPEIQTAFSAEPAVSSDKLFPGTAAPLLSDMEGYGGYQAAAVFFPPHRIFTWKIVSDHGYPAVHDSCRLTPTDLSGLITPHVEPILVWLEELMTQTASVQTVPSATVEQAFPLIWLLADHFEYSVTQRNQLTQLLRYADLTGYTESELSDGLLPKGNDPRPHPAQKKQEGKRILYELEQRILP